MLNLTTVAGLQAELNKYRQSGRSIGFVPTMGALHQGHISLVERSKRENDCTVVSIFVNPTQFNNTDDLKNYPRMPEADIKMLRDAGADVLFMPAVEEVYGNQRSAIGDQKSDNSDRQTLNRELRTANSLKQDLEIKTLNPEPGTRNSELTDSIPNVPLGSLATVMEGAFRPGHFDGVVQVVSILFKIVQPDEAYFGEKDFQQLAVIRFMTKYLKFNVEVIGCPTVRETSGLAMSSRNLRLNPTETEAATHISKALRFIRDNWKTGTPEQLRQKAIEQLEKEKLLKIEYLEIADSETLQPVIQWNENTKARAFAAVFCGPVRLIDNVAINVSEGF